MLELAPQAGPQTDFLASPADIVIYGGSAGGGKTYGLLLEPLRHVNVPGFGAVIFRRTIPQVRSKGGLWDTACELYGDIPGVELKGVALKVVFPNGVDIAFRHLEYEKNVRDWDGSQIPLLAFDELQHFTRSQFRYLLSRNRSTCGIPAYVRATCNPEPDSWILELISWYIQENGYPSKDRCGTLRYFWTHNERFVTAATREELRHLFDIPSKIEDNEIRSVTFIHADLDDNPALTSKDPSYRANLMLQTEAERERLLLGNWKARRQGKMFRRPWFKTVEPDERSYVRVVVGCDPSGGAGKGHDAQGIVAVAKGRDGNFYVLEDATCGLSPGGWGKVTVQTYAEHRADMIVAEGNFGGDMVISTIRAADQYANVKKVTASRGKAVRAEPIAALYEQGRIFHVGAKPELEDELTGFDPTDSRAPSPNRMDALVWAITELMGEPDTIMDYYRQLAAEGEKDV